MTPDPANQAGTLWCVYVEGPDDLYAAVSKEAAQLHADPDRWRERNE